MLDLQGNLLKRVGKPWGNTGGGELQGRKNTGPEVFNDPTEIAVSDQEVAVLDTAGTRVQIMDLEGLLLGGFSVLSASYQKLTGKTG